MGKIVILIILLLAALIIIPSMLSSCGGDYEDNDDSNGINISYKTSKKTARSRGGSRSYRGGK